MSNEVDINELLKLLDSEETPIEKVKVEDPTSIRRQNKDVLNFIRKMEIDRGFKKYPSYLIYYHYAIWARVTGRKKFSSIEFFKTFKQLFTQKRTGKQRYYLINEKLEINDDLLEKAKKYPLSFTLLKLYFFLK